MIDTQQLFVLLLSQVIKITATYFKHVSRSEKQLLMVHEILEIKRKNLFLAP